MDALLTETGNFLVNEDLTLLLLEQQPGVSAIPPIVPPIVVGPDPDCDDVVWAQETAGNNVPWAEEC